MQQPNNSGLFSVGPMKASDIEPLADSLCETDCRELDLLGSTAINAMRHSFLLGSYVARRDGIPVAAFGVNHDVEPKPIWFLSTDDRHKFPVEFHKLAKVWVKFLTAGITCGNVVPADHHGTIKWLKSLDFTFEDKPYIIQGHEFLKFMSSSGPATSPLHH